MIWVIFLMLAAVAVAVAIFVWARAQGLVSAHPQWRWIAVIGAAIGGALALLSRRRPTLRTTAAEQVRDVMTTEAAIETQRLAVEDKAQAITQRAAEDAAKVRSTAARSASLEDAADALTDAFGDP